LCVANFHQLRVSELRDHLFLSFGVSRAGYKTQIYEHKATTMSKTDKG